VKKLLVAGAVFACFGSTGAWADTQEEVNKQISKLIGDAVSTRVSSSVAAQADAQLPNNVWGTYSNLGIKAGGTNVHTDIGVVGYDREISKNITVGAALSYSNTGKFDSDDWGISPYIAYRFNTSMFGVLRANYTDGSSDSGSTHTNYRSDGIAASINGVHNFDKVYLQWRGEVGGTESRSSTRGHSSTTSSTIYIADGEVGYRFDNGVRGFAGLQLSTTNRDDSYGAYARIGLEKELGKNGAINIKYETLVDDSYPRGTNLSVDTFSIGARLRF
jgi:hypothetical protein